MTDHVAPPWLVELQARFGAMLRTPLSRRTGTLRPTPDAYPRALVDEVTHGGQRLAVYNRQYWFRLFGILAGAFPLTARLLGHWRFNEEAAAFLAEHPPRDWNVDRVPDGFASFFSTRETRTAADAALLEAVAIDEAWRSIHHSKLLPVWRLGPKDASRLVGGRLLPSPSVLFVEEHWPLVDLRGRVVEDESEDAVPLPPSLDVAQSWAVVRRPNGVGAMRLEPLEALLFALLREHPVDRALAELEARCAAEERSELPQRARGWLMRSVELGFWRGLQ